MEFAPILHECGDRVGDLQREQLDWVVTNAAEN